MKNIKYLFILSITSLMFNACVVEDGENPYYAPSENGIFPNYVAGNNSVYNLLDPTNSIVDFVIQASVSGGATASTGEIHATINGGAYSKLDDISGFPYSVSMSLQAVVDALSTSTSSLTGGDLINFKTFFNDASGAAITSTSVFTAAIVCPPVAGTYTIDMQDSYGDGWQGGGINAILDGVTTFIGLPSQAGLTGGQAIYVVPVGSTALVWEWVDDSYNSEVSFQVTDPNSLLILDIADPTAGVLSVPSTCP